MTAYTVEAARYAHVNRIANRMRRHDVIECAAFGHGPKKALTIGLHASTLCWTILADGEPIAMLGCVPASIIDRRGTVWMLGTDALDRAARGFLKLAPPLVAAMRVEFPNLSNMCAVENIKAIRLLKRLGFAFDDEIVYVSNVPFRRFSIGPD